jgi:hypothetical protein
VDDLSSETDEQVMNRTGPALGPLLLLVLSYAGTRELARSIPTWRDLFAQVYAGPYGLRKLHKVLYFLVQRGDQAAYKAARKVVHSLLEAEDSERLMRTMADVFEARAKRKWGPILKAEGLAKGLLKVLAVRGLQVDDASRQIIEDCKDPATLERWLDRAAVATRIEDVLDSPQQ